MKSNRLLMFPALLASVMAMCAMQHASAKTQWTINQKAYDVDTLVYPHQVGPGVVFSKYDLPGMPLKVSVMEMDLKNKYIDFETCLGGDKGVSQENPLSMATRNDRPGHEVVGATNGDFYFYQNTLENGIPRSGQFRRDECVTNPVGRACFVLSDDRRPFIDRVDFAGTITYAGATVRLHTVNMQRLEWEDTGGNQINLYTNSYGSATEKCSGGSKVIIAPKSTPFKWYANSPETCVVEQIIADGEGVTAIPDGKAVLWAQGSCMSTLTSMKVGDELTINLGVDLRNQPGLLKNFKEVMGGSDNIIMQNGQLVDEWDERHPRTCIGFSADSSKVYFVVIDGRSTSSTGVTLSEAAGVFLGLGAVNAVNLDGGGSSCMVVNGEVVNTPSDGSLRAVGNGCLLISNAPVDDAIGQLAFSPRSYNVSISAKIKPAVWGYNKYGVLKNKDVQGVAFSCDEHLGHFTADGYFVASPTATAGNLYADYNGIKCSQRVVVYNAEKVLRDDSVTVDRNHKYEIRVLGKSGESNDLVDPSIINWTSADPAVCTVSAEGVIVPVANGRTMVTGVADGFNDSLVVRVENPATHVAGIESPVVVENWTVAQSGGKNRTVEALDNGLRIKFTGASSRVPYVKLTNKTLLWGLPDTVRIRFVQTEQIVKNVTLAVSTTEGKNVVRLSPMTDFVTGENVIDFPVDTFCDVTDCSQFPLKLAYVNFNMQSIKAGTEYTFDIPGLELVYGSGQSGVTTIKADAKPSSLAIYPNPAEAGSTVKLNCADCSANVYDTAGRLVRSVAVTGGAMSTAGLAKGIYVVRLSDGASARLVVK